MCGRYASARSRIELLEEFEVQRDRVGESLPPDYNVAPTKPVYAVLTRQPRAETADAAASDKAANGNGASMRTASGNGASDKTASGNGASDKTANGNGANGSGTAERQLRVVRWGFVPFWAKDVSIGSRMINARAETVSEEARVPGRVRQAPVLASGGWILRSGSRRHLLAPRAPSSRTSSAGRTTACLPSPVSTNGGGTGPCRVEDPAAWLWTATVITTSAPDELGEIHDRMPMVIDRGTWADWLDPGNTEVSDVQAMLAPAASTGLISYPVAQLVNSVRNNGPELIEQADPVAPGMGGRSDA